MERSEDATFLQRDVNSGRDHAPRFIEVSPWVSEPQDPQQPLLGDIKADVVIVGGGFTGLSTALELRARGVDVAILESDFCGRGASGRNAGHLTPTIGKDFPSLVKSVGADRAIEYARFAERAVRHTEALIQSLRIDCEYAPAGNVVAGLHVRHRGPLERGADLAARLGVDVTFLDERDVRARMLPAMVRFGVLEKCGGHLHPGKYVAGLRAAALRAGVRIFEQSRVTRIDDAASPSVVSCATGSVVAEKLVLATNAYTPSSLGRLKSRIFPLRVTLFRTNVLRPEEWDRVGWAGREGLYTAHEALENYRPQADGRISGGSKFVQYGFGSRLSTGYLPEVFAKWEMLFAQRFPELRDVRIEDFWGGWIGMTLDFLPLHQSNRKGTVFHALGYNGHGIAQASYAGPMVAAQVLGEPNAEVDLFRRHILPLPPEPLRWLGVQALTKSMEWVDRKVDAELGGAGNGRA
jgi:glycine/D-amino acid oxidase-like deaminating enzyme